MQLSSYQYPEVYKSLKIDVRKLFCTMLYCELGEYYKEKLPQLFGSQDLFYSKNLPWAQGLVADRNPHLTLLFGTLPIVKVNHIKEVLQPWISQEVKLMVDEYSYFESTNDEEYYCIVAKIKTNSSIMEAHERLSLLPHINTFGDYRPHVTIAYIKKNDEIRDYYINRLNGINPYDITVPSGFFSLNLKPIKIIYDNATNEQLVHSYT